MKTQSLNGIWTMTDASGEQTQGSVPGSVYSFLLDAGKMEDPFYRDNELEALKLMEQDYVFGCSFDADEAVLESEHQVLRFDGIDTLSEVRLNGSLLGTTDNMHLYWEYDVKDLLQENGNELSVRILSPTRYIKEVDQQYHIGASTDAMAGCSQLRKAHCMFGWDWGPRLPDGGIWKDVSLLGWDASRILEVKVVQRHLLSDGTSAFAQARFGEENLYRQPDPEGYLALARRHVDEARSGQLQVELTVTVEQTGEAPVRLTLVDPQGREMPMEEGVPYLVSDPQLWWPNGLGDQPLYTVRAELIEGSEAAAQETVGAGRETVGTGQPAETAGRETENRKTAQAGLENAPAGRTLQCVTKRIGLRTITMRRQKDQWGETFATEVNGQTFFAMGADYIPEDNILSRCNEALTRKLLSVCKESHFNVIRVWGGGYYPSDYFYDICDEIGLVVWQDMMFACANYPLTDAFVASIREEIAQNVRRLRHHASLGLWCGNNEMESFVADGEYEATHITHADYLIQNEFIIPEILKKEDPETMYWPSSPSSGGKLDMPQDPNRGDVHYWNVWHGGVPFTEYRQFCFRYLSEFGFQSFPCLETVKSFTEPEDRNIFSYVMEMHQRNAGANGKIMTYLAQTYRYPRSFETMLYASGLLQAEAIRYGVEHFRRNRNDDRCMGAVYWQLNDIWPVASWSSVDYFHRWKALQYSAKKFFAPVMLSCEEDSLSSQHVTCVTQPGPRHFGAKLCVTNETWDPVEDTVIWELRDEHSHVLLSGRQAVTVAPFSSLWLDEIELSGYSEKQMQHNHLTYRLASGRSEGSVLFVPAKHYAFADPQLSVTADPQTGTVTIESKAYARSVEVYSENGYVRFDDNYFDMEAGAHTIRLIEADGGAADFASLRVRSVYDI